jgi:hypothetical protein
MERTAEAMELHRSFAAIQDPDLRRAVLDLARRLSHRAEGV